MKSAAIMITVIFGIFSVFLFSGVAKTAAAGSEDLAAEIFAKSCSTAGCHQGRFPAMNLNLGKDSFKQSLIDVSSQELSHLKLVDTETPEKSYLLMKITGDKAIMGKRMPLNAPSLQDEDIRTIESWIRSLKSETPGDRPGGLKNPPPKKMITPAFWGTRLVNLPTTRTIDKNRVLFRISHRYFPAVSDGYDDFYGLDGPAVILLSLGYGISDSLSITLARSNRFKEVELSLKWLLFEQGRTRGIPFSAALNVGGAVVTDSLEGEKTFQSKNMKFNAQLSLSYKFSHSVSLLVVPAYSSNTNHWETPSEDTLSLGFGARYVFPKDLSIIAEWVPILTGYKEESSGWGLGVEKKIGGHVFQVFITNSIGLTSAQFVPGGTLKLGDGDFRVGFNIFRIF